MQRRPLPKVIGEVLCGDDGTWLLVEPMTATEGPVARTFTAASVGICTPSAQAQDGGFALGTQVSDDRGREAGRGRSEGPCSIGGESVVTRAGR